MDTDGSGALSYDELEQLVFDLGMSPSKEELQVLLDTYDTDCGVLELPEFLLLAEGLRRAGPPKEQFWPSAQRLFGTVDPDAPVTEEKLKAVFRIGEAGGISELEYTELIREADIDGDGSLTIGELYRALIGLSAREPGTAEEPPPLDPKKVEEMNQVKARIEFARFDDDGGGQLSTDELRNLVATMGIAPTDQELSEWVEEMDADGSGTLDVQEFEKMYCSKLVHLTKPLERFEAAIQALDIPDTAELHRVHLQRIFTHLKPDEIDTLYHEADIDGDGSVTVWGLRRVLTEE